MYGEVLIDTMRYTVKFSDSFKLDLPCNVKTAENNMTYLLHQYCYIDCNMTELLQNRRLDFIFLSQSSAIEETGNVVAGQPHTAGLHEGADADVLDAGNPTRAACLPQFLDWMTRGYGAANSIADRRSRFMPKDRAGACWPGSYGCGKSNEGEWGERPELNRRHPDPQSGALTN